MKEYRYFENCVNYLSVDSKLKIYKNTVVNISTKDRIEKAGVIIKRDCDNPWEELYDEEISIMELEKIFIKKGFRYDSKKNITSREISESRNEKLMYRELYEYFLNLFREKLSDYEGLSLKEVKGEYKVVEEASITGAGEFSYSTSKCLITTFKVISEKFLFEREVVIHLNKRTVEEEVTREIQRELEHISLKMKLPRLNQDKVLYTLGKSAKVLLSEEMVGKLIVNVFPNGNLELSKKEKVERIEEKLTLGIKVDEGEYFFLHSIGEFCIKVKNAIFIKDCKAVGIIEECYFLLKEEGIAESIDYVGTNYRWFSHSKLSRPEFGVPKAICSLEAYI